MRGIFQKERGIQQYLCQTYSDIDKLRVGTEFLEEEMPNCTFKYGAEEEIFMKFEFWEWWRSNYLQTYTYIDDFLKWVLINQNEIKGKQHGK